MTTIEKITQAETLPALTAMYLADISESRGKQDLFTAQAPQKLKALREHSLIQSALSSSRIEGVEIDQARVNPIILGNPILKNRNEEEVYGYRQALNWIHNNHENILINEKTITNLHKLVKGKIWDAGKFREKPSNIIEMYSNGKSRIRFKTLDHQKIVSAMRKLINVTTEERETIHPLIAIISMNFDFLCIHPFRDGNGRVSRLLFLLQFYQLGFLAGRYISIERVIEQNKERYYETLEISSDGWHDRAHNPWHFINFMLYTIKTVYREFQESLEAIKSPRGAKTEMIINSINQTDKPFTVSKIQEKCYGVSLDLVRVVLKNLRKEGKVKCLGKGRNAQWMKIGNT